MCFLALKVCIAKDRRRRLAGAGSEGRSSPRTVRPHPIPRPAVAARQPSRASQGCMGGLGRTPRRLSCPARQWAPWARMPRPRRSRTPSLESLPNTKQQQGLQFAAQDPDSPRNQSRAHLESWLRRGRTARLLQSPFEPKVGATGRRRAKSESQVAVRAPPPPRVRENSRNALGGYKTLTVRRTGMTLPAWSLNGAADLVSAARLVMRDAALAI